MKKTPQQWTAVTFGFKGRGFYKLPSLVEAIEFHRRQCGWTALRMSQELGISNSNYSEFVHGKRRLSLNARKRAFALGVPASILLQEEN